MARLGRGQPNRPVVLRQPLQVYQHLTLGPFETSAEFPEIEVFTPDATVPLGVFETEAEFPALSIAASSAFTLPVFETEAEFPELAVSVPFIAGDLITADGQVEYNGVLWGTGTVKVQEITGWDSKPAVDSGNTERPSRHGAYAGRKLAQQRMISLRLLLDSSRDPQQVAALVRALQMATPLPEDDTEYDLVIRTYGTPLLARGVVTELDLPNDSEYGAGVARAGVLITCSDPRKYSRLRHGVDLTSGVVQSILNDGNASSHPLIRIPGPFSDPVFSNGALERVIEFDIDVEDGDAMIIDTDAGTVTVDGANKMYTLTGSSVPVQDWVIGPGVNPITYELASGSSLAALFWRDALL